MFSLKFFSVVILTSCLFTGGMSSGCHLNSQVNQNTSPTSEDSAADLKVIAEGSVSPITTPFVAVVRELKTYSALRGLAADLPVLNEEFFRANIVVAAFLGERNTGGYSVAISREPSGQIRVAEKAPGKDAMVPQMITSPFKLVSMATNGTPSVTLSLDERFKERGELYRVSNGTFTISGGIAGRKETYQLAGKFQVVRLGNLITLGLALVSTGTSRERTLRDFATGLVSENAIAIDKLNHGSLLDTPSADLQITGKFLDKNKVSLDLDSGPVTVPDGYSGKGNIAAEMVAASAN